MAKRRDKGQGYLKQQEDGRWRGAVFVGDKRHWRYGATKKAVQEKLDELIKSAKENRTVPDPRLTVETYLLHWLNGQRSSLAPGAWRRYEIDVRRRLIPEFGRIKLKELEPGRIRSYLAELRNEVSDFTHKPLSPASIRHVRLVLSKALNDATREQLINWNPAAIVEAPKVAKHEMIIWSPAELRTFLAATAADYYGPVWRMAAATGMRQGEILGLRWQDIDLDAGVVQITAKLERYEYQFHRGDPKTVRSRRRIPIDGETVAILRTHRTAQLRRQMAAGPVWGNLWDLVFTSETGSPIHARTLRSHLSKALDRVAVPRIRFHDLRHTHASILLASLPVTIVAERLGHTSTRMTLDVYGHLLPGMAEAAVGVMEKALREPLSGALSGSVATQTKARPS